MSWDSESTERPLSGLAATSDDDASTLSFATRSAGAHASGSTAGGDRAGGGDLEDEYEYEEVYEYVEVDADEEEADAGYAAAGPGSPVAAGLENAPPRPAGGSTLQPAMSSANLRKQRATRSVAETVERRYTYADVNALILALGDESLRTRYKAIVDLSPVVRAKEWQSVVGNRLGRKGLALIFRELNNDDRGVRIAAAKLICDLAYQCPENQPHISFHAGFTIDHVRIFAAPPAIVASRSPRGKKGRMETDKQAVLEDIVQDWPESKNPKFWCYPPFIPSRVNVFPDPREHLVGFFLCDAVGEPDGADSAKRTVATRSPSRPSSAMPVMAGGVPPRVPGSAAAGRPLSAQPASGRAAAARPMSARPASGASSLSKLFFDDGDDLSVSLRPATARARRPKSARARLSASDGSGDASARPASARRPGSARAKKNVFERLSQAKKVDPYMHLHDQYRPDYDASKAAKGKSAKGKGKGKRRPMSARPVLEAGHGARPPSAPRTRPASARPTTKAPGGSAMSPARPSTTRPQSATPRGRVAVSTPSRPGSARPSSGRKGSSSRPRSAPARRPDSATSARGGIVKATPRSAMARAFWDSIETSTHLSASNINVGATLNMQLHPAVAAYRWKSAVAQKRILQACSETPDARGAYQLEREPVMQAKIPFSQPRTRKKRPQSAAAGGAGGTNAGLQAGSGASTATATERRQFAVDVYESPFRSAAGENASSAMPDDPAMTMLEFQQMLVRTSAAKPERPPPRPKQTDTLVGLQVPGAVAESGAFTLDKMALREQRKALSEQKKQSRLLKGTSASKQR